MVVKKEKKKVPGKSIGKNKENKKLKTGVVEKTGQKAVKSLEKFAKSNAGVLKKNAKKGVKTGKKRQPSPTRPAKKNNDSPSPIKKKVAVKKEAGNVKVKKEGATNPKKSKVALKDKAAKPGTAEPKKIKKENGEVKAEKKVVKKDNPRLLRKKQKMLEKKKKNKTVNAVVSAQLDKRISNEKARKEKREARARPPHGVICLKHLPRGFYEEQINDYFQQFGHVTRVRVVRSLRTGRPKNKAFVEFDVPEVAEAAADSLKNSLMFNKIVEAYYIPPEKQTRNYFRTSLKKVVNNVGKPIYISHITQRVRRHVSKANRWSETNCEKRMGKSQKRLEEKKKRYEHLGINLDNIMLK